ncbi:methylthioribose-1-phosphate isomerase [Rhizobiales bacterium GAS191]|nr:methylthioribose-1-phosphate isomerase [Rhizobiales bacterium GAS191]
MLIEGRHTRTIWLEEDGKSVGILDQTKLPFRIERLRLTTSGEMAHAISSMQVRGAPLIGAAGAYGLALALAADPSDAGLGAGYDLLVRSRPTAINLKWALDRLAARVRPLAPARRAEAAFAEARAICDEDVAINEGIGRHGLKLIEEIASKKAGGAVNVLTHCNAGWLATVDRGTATSPIYAAQEKGLPIHVFVDETRPRNQGAYLTAFELGEQGVPHTLVSDNSGGHLMQHGLVDLVIVGTDRVTAKGDVANKIGTYLKALAAKDNGVPFYVALPSPTIDFSVEDGVRDIPIEERPGDEVTHVAGLGPDGQMTRVRITPERTKAANHAFDVTPSRLVTGLITERGVAPATREGLRALFPDRAA